MRLEHVARMKYRRNAYRVLFRKPQGNDHLEDLCIDEDNIKMDLKRIRRGCVLDSSGSGYSRHVYSGHILCVELSGLNLAV